MTTFGLLMLGKLGFFFCVCVCVCTFVASLCLNPAVSLSLFFSFFLFFSFSFFFFFHILRQMSTGLIDWLIDDRLYSAILRSLEQTHCARMWCYMSDKLFIACFWISTKVVYLQRWHGWCHMKLQPFRRKFCVHHTTMHHVTSCTATYVRCMRV